MELYQQRSREEESIAPAASSSFKIHKAPLSISQSFSNPPSLKTIDPIADESREPTIFEEDSLFADIFGAISSEPVPPPSEHTSNIVDGELITSPDRSLESSPEKPIAPTRMTLADLMASSIPHSDALRSSDALQLDVEITNDVVLADDIDLDDEFFSDESASESQYQNDASTAAQSQYDDDATTDDTGLPNFWTQSGSLANTIAAGHSLEIVEKESKKFSFDDAIHSEMKTSMAEKDDSNFEGLGPSSKKRRRVVSEEEDLDILDEKSSSSKKGSSSGKASSSKKTKQQNGDSLADPNVTSASTGKRENFRKLNLKNGYKKPKMDRETAGYARARKNAAALARSGDLSRLTPQLSDERSMEVEFEQMVEESQHGDENGVGIEEKQNLPSESQDGSVELNDLLNDPAKRKEAIPEAMMDRVLRYGMKVANFREGQREAITRILRGENTLLILPTGGGKSLVYQYPSKVWKTGVTMVVSPLLSLVADQLSKLPSLGLRGVALTSSMSSSEITKAIASLRSHQSNILFVSPEKLASQSFRNLIRQLGLSINLLAIDEAHCISQWSHNFRPAYLQLYKLGVEELGAKCVLAISATATERTAASITEILHIPQSNVLRYHPVRENLHLNFIETQEKESKLFEILKSKFNASTESLIIYVHYQRQADDLAALLLQKHVAVASFHAGKSHSERKQIQRLFGKGEIRIIVATIAFGMGVDMPSIRGVIHFSMPRSIENFVQEIGRAGRDGLPSQCYLLLSPQDVFTLRSFAHAETYDRPAVKALLVSIFQNKAKEKSSVQSDMFVALPIGNSEIQFDMKSTMIATILTWLDAMGKLKFQNIQVSASCDIAFTTQSLDTLRKQSRLMFDCAKVGKRGKGVLNVPLDQLATFRAVSIHDCIEQLTEAQESLGLKLDFKDPALVAQLDKEWTADETDEIIDEITAKIKNMEASNLSKIDAMYRLIAEDLDTPVAEKIRRYFAASENANINSAPSTGNSVLSSSNTAILALPAANPPSSAPSVAIDVRTLNSSFLAPPSASNTPRSNGSSTSSLLLRNFYNPTEMTKSHVIGDVKTFLSIHGEHITSARPIARIFHGISSPVFPKEQWLSNRFWGRSVHIPFELILSIAQEQLIARAFL